MTGWEAIEAAADRAATQTGPDPYAEEECPQLVAELEAFLDDPYTVAYGMGSEMSPMVVRQHVARHGCQGLGRA